MLYFHHLWVAYSVVSLVSTELSVNSLFRISYQPLVSIAGLRQNRRVQFSAVHIFFSRIAICQCQPINAVFSFLNTGYLSLPMVWPQTGATCFGRAVSPFSHRATTPWQTPSRYVCVSCPRSWYRCRYPSEQQPFRFPGVQSMNGNDSWQRDPYLIYPQRLPLRKSQKLFLPNDFTESVL